MQVAILLGLRQVEARELRWREVYDDRIIIPASRYKTNRDHVLPLGPVVTSLLGEPRDPDAFVFSGAIPGKPPSHAAFANLLIQLGLEAETTSHGWRTVLAMWAVEQGGFTDELAQRVLGHVIGTPAMRAYQQSLFLTRSASSWTRGPPS